MCSYMEQAGENGMAFSQTNWTWSNPIVSNVTSLLGRNSALYFKLNWKPQLEGQNLQLGTAIAPETVQRGFGLHPAKYLSMC